MKRNLIKAILAVGALAAISTNSNAAALIVMHSPSNGNNYVAYNDQKTYAQAQAYCESKQGHLAVFNSNAEVTELNKYLSLYPANTYWLGHTISTSNAYTTITGQIPFGQTVLEEQNNNPANTAVSLSLGIADYPYHALNKFIYLLPSTIAGFVCEFEESTI